MIFGEKVRRQIGGRATLAGSSQDEDRWRATQEGGHSGVGGVAGHFSKKREKWRTPRLFQAMLKDKPASYFVVKVAHPPDRN